MNTRFTSPLIAAASILVFFLLVLPAFDKSRMLSNALEERENASSQAQEILVQVDSFIKSIEANKANVDKLDLLLPKDKDIPEILTNLEAIMSSAGVNLTEISFSDVPTQSEVKKIGGDIKFTGDFTSFLSFLELAEKNLRLVNLISFDINPQDVGGRRVMNFDLRFEINYLSSSQ